MKLTVLLLSLPLFALPALACETTWGLKRISQEQAVDLCGKDQKEAVFESYVFDGKPEELGKGVDIYILDSGVDVSHPDFGGRAKLGFSVDDKQNDVSGHGTHCAGTAGSTTYGVAKGANLISVRVAVGRREEAGYIRGIDWMIERHESRKNEPDFHGSVASLSGGRENAYRAPDFNAAILKAIAAKIHFVVSAGNQGIDACCFAPAELGKDTDVVTVGATDINDLILGTAGSGSNWGNCVNIYAPGQHVLSTWHEEPRTSVQSGTSMATPHVSGLMAVFLGQNPGLKFDTKAMKEMLKAMSVDPGKQQRIKVVTVRIANNGKKQAA